MDLTREEQKLLDMDKDVTIKALTEAWRAGDTSAVAQAAHDLERMALDPQDWLAQAHPAPPPAPRILSIVIMSRKDLPRVTRAHPLELIGVQDLTFGKEEREADLILFEDPDRVKVLKNRRLGGTYGTLPHFILTGTILPKFMICDLIQGRLDLGSPRVVTP